MAVVVRDNTVLIQKRYRSKTGFVYEFPGGAIDAKESSEEAARRELFEETGMDCGELLGNHRLRNEHGGDVYFVVISATPGAEPKQVCPERQQTFYWFAVKDIPRGDFFPADIEFIETCLDKYTR